jgi:hypothetical protein
MSVEYGNSYTDKKTQSTMMKFLKKSNQFTGSSRLGKSQPRTQLNKDAKPKNDFFDNPRLKVNSKGLAKGSNFDERQNEKPVKLNKRNESQKTDYKPRSKKATGRPTNISKVSRRFK